MIMKRIFVLLAIFIISIGVITIPIISEQFANAKSTKKFHFTETITSSQDPGQGYQDNQFILVLPPNLGTLYDGSITYTASRPIQIVVLHEINPAQSKGQPTWTVDGQTHYALSLFDPAVISGSFEFTGAALALRATNNAEFTATVSVDGWIRGQPIEIIMQTIQVDTTDPKLKLSRAHTLVEIPLHTGLYNGENLLYIITDASDKRYADLITEKQDWTVQLAPFLSDTPKEALGNVYVFTNGIEGSGIYGYQNEVFSSTPAQTDVYSALRLVHHVEWRSGQNTEILDSAEKILKAKEEGRIKITDKETIINMPHIKWPTGQMPVKNDSTITDDMPYGDSQILEINEKDMIVTFIAHRGWGPDGRTIYQIVTDATPTELAQKMGVVDSPTSANLMSYPAAADLFRFSNGIIGSGSLGFQPGVTSAVSGDENYSPMWRIFIVEWDDSSQASVLETRADIDSFHLDEVITVTLARPLNSAHIINSPIIVP